MIRFPGKLVFVPVLLASCATTTVTRTWRDPGFGGPPLQKVLVCSLSRDEVTRRQIEDAFVLRLRADGVTGIPCYNVLPAGQTTGQQLQDVAASQGVDGILETLPAHVREVPVYSVAPAWAYGVTPGWGPYYDAWGTDWGYVYGTGWAGEQTQVTIQAKAYSLQQNGKLIWAGTSQTFDPSSEKSLISQIVPRFINAMAKSGVLPPPAAS